MIRREKLAVKREQRSFNEGSIVPHGLGGQALEIRGFYHCTSRAAFPSHLHASTVIAQCSESPQQQLASAITMYLSLVRRNNMDKI